MLPTLVMIAVAVVAKVCNADGSFLVPLRRNDFVAI
jgi:hypothetical protein